ncbi:hypothetical protein PWT90_10437 [Aphanocladium album]|nr:hypothetical protein PWT90_10437 [Aphanocladium album]
MVPRAACVNAATGNERQTGRKFSIFQSHILDPPALAMVSGFIGQELSETTSSPSPTTSQQQLPRPPHTADSQTGPTATYIPVDSLVSEVDAAHNTLLVGLLVALVAASVALGCLIIYCLRRRAQKKTQREYKAELHEMQRKSDDERAARAA